MIVSESAPAIVPRRDALKACACLLASSMIGCSGAAPPTGTPPLEFADDAATVRDNVVEIDVSRVPQWRASPAVESAVVFLSVQVIVVRRTADRFTALSAVCPHAGCGVSVVRGDQLVCPCHGSTYTFSGERVSGPAPTGLTSLPATFDASGQRLTISWSA